MLLASEAMEDGSNVLTACGVRSGIRVGEGRVYVACENGSLVCRGAKP